MFSAEKYKSELNTDFLGQNIIYVPETGSTNQDSWKYIDQDCPNGSIVITDTQNQGKGRRNNSWKSISNKSLTFSLILYQKSKLNYFPILPLLTGVSIVNGIYNSSYIQLGLKWPNDIMLSQRKMGGILIETKSTNKGLCIVIGIGLNINETEFDIHPEVKDYSTSLSIYSGEKFVREKLLAEVLNSFETLYSADWNDIISIWSKYCIHNNSIISFNNDDGYHKGLFQGINQNGHALIMIDEKLKTFSGGVVTL